MLVKEFHGALNRLKEQAEFAQEISSNHGCTAVHLMRTIKRACDPQNIMNPDRIFTL